jgi:hypothetical protein
MDMVIRKTFRKTNLKHVDGHRITDIDQYQHDQLNEPILKPDDQKKDQTEDPHGKPKTDHAEHPPATPLRRLTLTMAEVKHIYNDVVEQQEREDVEDQSVFDKISKYTTMPVEFVAMTMIPNVDSDMLDKWYVPLIPFNSSLAILTFTRSRLLSLRLDFRAARTLDHGRGSCFWDHRLCCCVYLAQEERPCKEVVLGSFRTGQFNRGVEECSRRRS